MRFAVGALFLLLILVGSVPKVQALAPECSYSVAYDYFMRVASIGCDYDGLKRKCCPLDGDPLHKNFRECIQKHYKNDPICRQRVLINDKIYNMASRTIEGVISSKIVHLLLGMFP